ncbi:MAG: hypothetical protein Q8R24_09340 [Legionellaceae bacterium]|nr:hypothetical protein [Legionellaceae bacterium]
MKANAKITSSMVFFQPSLEGEVTLLMNSRSITLYKMSRMIGIRSLTDEQITLLTSTGSISRVFNTDLSTPYVVFEILDDVDYLDLCTQHHIPLESIVSSVYKYPPVMRDNKVHAITSFIIKFKESTSEEIKKQIFEDYALPFVPPKGRRGYYLIECSHEQDPVVLAAQLQQNPHIDYAEPDLPMDVVHCTSFQLS